MTGSQTPCDQQQRIPDGGTLSDAIVPSPPPGCPIQRPKVLALELDEALAAAPPRAVRGQLAAVRSRYERPGRKWGVPIQQYMMRVSSNLRRFRWAVFAVWLMLLVPSVYLAMHQSGNLTGGGFEVEDSQSLYVQRQLEAQFPDQGSSPLALVAAPRADASFDDMNQAVAYLQRLATEVPSVTVLPNPASAAATAGPAVRHHPAARFREHRRRGHRQAAARTRWASTATSRARRPTARSVSTSSARARWGRRPRWPPSTTSPRRRSGTCRSC